MHATETSAVALGFPPDRASGLARLSAFLPRAGRSYASRRNYDLPGAGHPHVSGLSPYIRHRMVTEAEVLLAVRARHSPSAAEKFIQEVFWRTYWKGWLELRPEVWDTYQCGLRRALDRVQTEAGLRSEWEAACRGETGIDGFDEWARELSATGYLHNHARMWFASIWIFTLRLPWELGADLFLRQLLDGDPASNTLGWRWVAGLQTRGKTYLARAQNMARYTEGRVRPAAGSLAQAAPPLAGPPPPAPRALPDLPQLDRTKRTVWLLTEEDLMPGSVLTGPDPAAVAFLDCTADRSPLTVADRVVTFADAAIEDCARRLGDRAAHAQHFGGRSAVAEIRAWARDASAEQVLCPYAPVGPAATAIRALDEALAEDEISLIRVLRPYDREAWPHATHGYFKFRAKIPDLLNLLDAKDAA